MPSMMSVSLTGGAIQCKRSQGVWGLNADQSRRDQAAGPGTGWPQHPLTPCTSIVPVDDRFLGGTGFAPPSDCPWCSPSLGTVYARGHQTVRPVQLYYLSPQRAAVPE